METPELGKNPWLSAWKSPRIFFPNGRLWKLSGVGVEGGNSWFYVVVNFCEKLNADNLEFIFYKLNRYF